MSRTIRVFLPLLLSLPARPARAEIEEQHVAAAAAPPPAPTLTRAPELLEFVSAEYPPELLAEGKGGEVVLLIDIDDKGKVAAVEVASTTDPAFGPPAAAAAARFLFSPAEVDGVPAMIRIEYRYVFEPQTAVPDAISGEPPPAAGTALLPVNFAGRVLEAGTRRPLGGAVLQINGRPAAETDDEGRFSLRGVALGTIKVRLTSPNHAPYEVEEELKQGEGLQVKYYLVRKSRDPFETVVRTHSERREVAKVELARQEVSKVPGTFGDPVRVIENLPGMGRAPGGLGGSLLVRGERPSSTKVYMDGVQIPQLYHFGGLTSVVNAEFLENIDFYPGGFGARYGDAIAGVVDVQSRDLDCDMWRASAEVDFADAAAFSCVPLGNWAVAAATRRSYIDVTLGLALDAVPMPEDQGVITLAPYYWDYQAKARGVIGQHALDLFVFGAHDRLELVQEGSAESVNMSVGMTLTSHRLLLRDRWRLGDNLTLTSSIAPGYSLQKMETAADEIDMKVRYELPIWSVDWREDLTFKIMRGLTLRGGLDHRFGSATFEMEAPMQTARRFPAPVFDFTNSQTFSDDIPVFNQGYWVELEIEPGFGLKLIPGLRVDRWDFLHMQGFSVEPRLTARYELISGSTIKAAYGLYEQLPEAQYLMDSFGNPNLEPERGQHFIIGFEQKFTPLIHLDVQGFYNLKSHRPVWSNNVRYVDGQRLSENYESAGMGRAYGVEILLRHLATADGWFYGWLAYTLSRSEQRDREPGETYRVEQADGSATTLPYSDKTYEWYVAQYDQTHILTLVGQFVLPWGIEAGFRFRLVSGNPRTATGQGVRYYDADTGSFGIDLTDVPRRSARMPTFHQLDIRIDKTFTFSLWRLTPYLEVINVYNAKNVEQYMWDYRYRRKDAITLLPVVPILGVKGEF